MSLEIEVDVLEDGGEVTYKLPAKYVVCSHCEGHGTHLNEAIRQHAYSMEEFEREFPEPEQREAYFRRGGMYDVQCSRCKGLRVVAIVDRRQCSSPEQQRLLKELDRQAREEESYQQLVQSELRYGC